MTDRNELILWSRERQHSLLPRIASYKKSILDDSPGLLSDAVMNQCLLSKSDIHMQFQYGIDCF